METQKILTAQTFQVQPITSKIMCTVFYSAESIVLIDNMPHKITVTNYYYADFLQGLHVSILENFDFIVYHKMLIIKLMTAITVLCLSLF